MGEFYYNLGIGKIFLPLRLIMQKSQKKKLEELNYIKIKNLYKIKSHKQFLRRNDKVGMILETKSLKNNLPNTKRTPGNRKK